MNLSDTRKRLDRLKADAESARSEVVRARDSLRDAKERSECLRASRVLTQEVAQEVQRVAHARIASVVSRCLETVFGTDAYEFEIDFERKRGKTEARLRFRRGKLSLDPLGAAGVGQVDVAALALRLACLCLKRPRSRRLLVLDEPAKNVNGCRFQERVGELLESLAEDFGTQMLIVSDDDWLKVGKVVEL